jgi:hypothetical protein
MNECGRVQREFSGYLDGAISGIAMQKIAQHLEECSACAIEFAEWRNAQLMVSSLGPAKAPEDLALRLRVALSHESSRTPGESFARLRVRWQNSIRPLILQASAGLASTVLLIGSVSLLIGMFASPEPLSARDQPLVSARDEPLGMASDPHFLYSSFEPSATIGDRDHPAVVVEAFVDGQGRVYDYKIISGPTDSTTRSQLVNALLFTVFAPARAFGQPVRGTAILSFSGVSVRG